MGNEQTHILIVDDSEDDRELYARYLSQKGYRVSMARDGKECLQMALDLHPHLILMDLRLPALDGWQATRLLKADERTKDCRVVVVTGLTWLQPKSLECDGWLVKPCPLDLLGAEIASILEPGGEAKGLAQQ